MVLRTIFSSLPLTVIWLRMRTTVTGDSMVLIRGQMTVRSELEKIGPKDHRLWPTRYCRSLKLCSVSVFEQRICTF